MKTKEVLHVRQFIPSTESRNKQKRTVLTRISTHVFERKYVFLKIVFIISVNRDREDNYFELRNSQKKKSYNKVGSETRLVSTRIWLSLNRCTFLQHLCGLYIFLGGLGVTVRLVIQVKQKIS